ncbi:MAG: hypothetical protein R3E98_06600 [Gemmatimonadota bacterium]
MFYIRFRNGQFRVRVSREPTTHVTEAVRGVDLVDEEIHGSEDDGFMDEAEMLERTAWLLDFSGSARLELDE